MKVPTKPVPNNVPPAVLAPFWRNRRRVNASIAPNRINAVLFKEIVVQ